MHTFELEKSLEFPHLVEELKLKGRNRCIYVFKTKTHSWCVTEELKWKFTIVEEEYSYHTEEKEYYNPYNLKNEKMLITTDCVYYRHHQ